MPRLSIDFQESDNPRSGVLLCEDSLASGGGGGGGEGRLGLWHPRNYSKRMCMRPNSVTPTTANARD